MTLIMMELILEKKFSKIETKSNIFINIFYYEIKLIFPIYISDQKFENSVDLLLIIDENKSHYVCMKDFDRFILPKTKNTFAKVVYSVSVVAMF